MLQSGGARWHSEQSPILCTQTYASTPRANEAFHKLIGAYDWVKDHQQWQEEQDKQMVKYFERLTFNQWLKQGGALRLWEVEEALERERGVVEVMTEVLIMLEEREWELLKMRWVDEMPASATPRHSTRVRSQPQRYQSEEVEVQERERRRRALRGEEEDVGVNLEEESHDWREPGLERPNIQDQFTTPTPSTTHPGSTHQG